MRKAINPGFSSSPWPCSVPCIHNRNRIYYILVRPEEVKNEWYFLFAPRRKRKDYRRGNSGCCKSSYFFWRLYLKGAKGEERENKEVDCYSRMNQEVKVPNTASILSRFLETHRCHGSVMLRFRQEHYTTRRRVERMNGRTGYRFEAPHHSWCHFFSSRNNMTLQMLLAKFLNGRS